MKQLFSLILILFIVGCSTPQPKPITQPVIETPVVVENTTNTTPVVIFPKISTPHYGNLTIYFIDVAQGDAIFIVTPENKTMLIDGGSREKGITDVSFIRNVGFNKIDYAIATHPDEDHIGGLVYAIQKLKPEKIYDNGLEKDTQVFKEYLSVTNNTRQIVKYDSAFDFGNNILASFIVPYDDGDGYSTDSNSNSILFRITYGTVSFLFAGDCDEECEARIGDSMLNSIVLKVGHHSSCSSSTMYFLNKVNPKYSVISVGENSYGHPCQDAMIRLQSVGSALYRTDLNGDITITTDGNKISILTIK